MLEYARIDVSDVRNAALANSSSEAAHIYSKCLSMSLLSDVAMSQKTWHPKLINGCVYSPNFVDNRF